MLSSGVLPVEELHTAKYELNTVVLPVEELLPAVLPEVLGSTEVEPAQGKANFGAHKQ